MINVYTMTTLCTNAASREDENMDKETTQDRASAAPGEASHAPVAHLNIRDARAKLSKLVNDMESSQLTVTLGRRNSPTAVLTSYSRFEPVLSGDYKSRLAFIVVENLLDGAPRHIRNPQIEELAHASKDDLLLLARVEELPLGQRSERELRKKLSDSRLLDRLLKRHQIARAIASAQKEGLYEAAEDLTSRVDLEPDDTTRATG
ncbi:MAG: hypothetical protein R6V85_02030 [Polyangia bacterium]